MAPWSLRSPRTTSAPRAANAWARGEFRARTRTLAPSASRRRMSAPPRKPVPPVTQTHSGCAAMECPARSYLMNRVYRGTALRGNSRLSFSRGSCAFPEELLILGGGVADNGFEVIDEVSLVEVAQFERQFRPVQFAAGVKFFNEFHQAIPADNPFGTSADIFAEESLQGALAEGAAAHKFVDGFDFRVGQNERDELARQGDGWIRFGNALEEKVIARGNFFVIRARRKHHGFEHRDRVAEDFLCRNDAVREARNGRAVEGPEAAGLEFDAEDTRLALEQPRKLS